MRAKEGYKKDSMKRYQHQNWIAAFIRLTSPVLLQSHFPQAKNGFQFVLIIILDVSAKYFHFKQIETTQL